ncbi:hypothetical protein PspLS_08405 [Pyricularia sp. CBS 133598]|nr:hypothetical protein PspLS_08405 [Pyricularia sp. CBS 133598]
MAALALLLPIINAEGGFTKTCFLGGASLDDKKYLATTCTNDKYEIYGFDYSALNLDWCLTNDGGRLAFASDGKFSGSCHECKFDKNSDKGRFSCKCSDRSGELKDESHVELDDVVYNRNGAMGCYDHVANKSRCRTCKEPRF